MSPSPVDNAPGHGIESLLVQARSGSAEALGPRQCSDGKHRDPGRQVRGLEVGQVAWYLHADVQPSVGAS